MTLSDQSAHLCLVTTNVKVGGLRTPDDLPHSGSSVCSNFFLSGVHNEPGESFLHFALIDYDVKFQLPRHHRMTLFAVMNKEKRLETFLAFKSPFRQDFLAISRG